jgi:glucose/arabinose dehydrogenase
MRCLALLLALALPGAAAAQSARIDGVILTLAPVAEGLDGPVALTSPPGDPRLFVVEQSGRIRIIADGNLQQTPFLDIAGEISSGGERGLLGLAFHPDHASNRRLFLYFTAPNGDIRIAEARADGSRADPASLRVLLTIPHREAANHNGGWLGFGPDGLLYAGIGDGGGAGDRRGNAQNPASLLGKILRLDVDGATPYAIPASNPFAKGGGAPEIFAMGLRNPWRNDFDGETLYIADVGQNEWEEISTITTADAGANLGWNVMEAHACFRAESCDPSGLVPPIHAYDHDLGCSITGGFVYRGSAIPALQGRYLFSDYCTGPLMSLRLEAGSATDITVSEGSFGNVTSFGEDSAGELYILTADGTVSRLIPAN